MDQTDKPVTNYKGPPPERKSPAQRALEETKERFKPKEAESGTGL